MKKVIAACLALTLLATGCAYAAVNSQRQEDAYQLYFLEADLEAAPGKDALRAENVYLQEEQEQDLQSLVQTLLEKLVAGPADETLESALPTGTTVLSVQVDGSRATVDLSYHYSALSGVALTLADYAITLTLTQLREISSVSITVQGQQLAYRDKQVFTGKDVLFSSTEDVVGTVTATLYFLDENGSLAPEERTLDLYEGDTQVGAVVQALESGPEGRNLTSALPEGFRVKSVWLEEDICYVNFSSSMLRGIEEVTALYLVLDVLEQSLRSLSTVNDVQFLVDGELTTLPDFPTEGS